MQIKIGRTAIYDRDRRGRLQMITSWKGYHAPAEHNIPEGAMPCTVWFIYEVEKDARQKLIEIPWARGLGEEFPRLEYVFAMIEKKEKA